jgi:hypothetical protein
MGDYTYLKGTLGLIEITYFQAKLSQTIQSSEIFAADTCIEAVIPNCIRYPLEMCPCQAAIFQSRKLARVHLHKTYEHDDEGPDDEETWRTALKCVSASA